MSHTSMTTLAFFLLLDLSPLLVFEFDFLSLLCNTNTIRNILMMIGTNVEQDEMMCCVQEWQLWRDWGDICFLLLFFFFFFVFFFFLVFLKTNLFYFFFFFFFFFFCFFFCFLEENWWTGIKQEVIKSVFFVKKWRKFYHVHQVP